MKFSQIVHNINKIMLKENKYIYIYNYISLRLPLLPSEINSAFFKTILIAEIHSFSR